MTGRAANSDEARALWWAASEAIANRYDLGDMFIQTMDEAAIDSMAVADPYTFLPAGERQRPFQVDVGTLLADQEAYNGFRVMLEHKRGMNQNRQFARGATRHLLDQVEAELDQRWQIPPVPPTGSIEGAFVERALREVAR